LHATEQTITLDGKKSHILVGKMHLVPTKVNQAVFHEGSASVAKKYYHGLGTDIDAVKSLAKREASLAGKSRTVVARAAGKIKAGKIAKGVLPFVGRNVVRAIPLVGTGLAILEFADNVEAHGISGAVARSTPVLGDLISAHDLGNQLAKGIADEAKANSDAVLGRINEPVEAALQKANDQTIKAFRELAPQIHVTNQRYVGESLVDPHEVADALRAYRDEMGTWNRLNAAGSEHIDYDEAAAKSKEALKKRLIEASQPQQPKKPGSMI
jgi:hypothetical protein